MLNNEHESRAIFINTRTMRGLSQVRIAKETGMSRYRLSLYEQGLGDLTEGEFRRLERCLKMFDEKPTLDLTPKKPTTILRKAV